MAFKNEYTVNVDIKGRSTNIVPTYKQGESAVLRFRVYDGNKLYDLADFTRAEIVFKLPSGDSVVGEALLVDGLITYYFTGVEMSEVGRVKTTISIYSGSSMVAVQPFIVHIYDSMKNQDLSYIGILQDLIAEVQLLEKTIGDSLADVDSKIAQLDGAVEAENKRESNEAQRILNENTRISSESGRVTAETKRVSDEVIRTSNETQRATDENARKLAETTRISNEESRQITFNDKISEISTSIDNANQAVADTTLAITNVNEAKTNAETATTNANLATSRANQAATDANLAKDATIQATVNANQATTNATNATTEAIKAKDSTLAAIANADVATTNAINATNNAQQVVDNTGSKGNFVLGQSYKKNNTVLSNGSTFIALQDTQMNPLPVLPITENTWWRLVAQRGIDGEGSVSSVNGIFPDVNGNVTLDLGDTITMVDGIAPDIAGNVITHTNKAVLDKLTDSGGQLNYNGKAIGKVSTVNGAQPDASGNIEIPSIHKGKTPPAKTINLWIDTN